MREPSQPTVRTEPPNRGRDANQPSDIPATGWKDVLYRLKREIKQDNISLTAAGVAFYSMVALVPALVALVSLYGILTGPADVERQLRSLTDAMPRDVATLLRNLLRTTSNKSSGGLGVGFAIGLVGAVWSASSGMRALINGLNIAYDEEERRKFVALRGRALLLTLGNLLFTLALLVALLAAPSALGDGRASTAIAIVRWPVIVVAVVGALAVIYRFGPDRDEPRWRWVSWGAVAATALWIIGSALFALYATHLGRFDKTYGALGGVVALLLWLYLTAFVVLLGAELNAEMEHQTARDTTRGPERPMGERDATMADHLGPPAPERG
jgi:membrane protein